MQDTSVNHPVSTETLDGFSFVKWVLDEHQNGSPVGVLLRAAKNHETDWLEMKAAVYPSAKDDSDYEKLLRETPPADLENAKKLYQKEIYKEIASAIIALRNSRGGVVLIGIDNAGCPVPLREGWNKEFPDLAGEEMDRFVREEVLGKILDRSQFKCRKAIWNIPVTAECVVVRELQFCGFPVLALLVPPLSPESKPFLVTNESTNGEGRKRTLLLRREPGNAAGQTKRKTIEDDWIESETRRDEYIRQRKELYLDNGDLARLRRDLSREIPFAIDHPRAANFVGRDEQLADVHRLLSESRIPIVTGPGGVGKTELLIQYADRHKEDYPGGLFQVDMGGVKNWDEAGLILLGSPHVDMRTILGLSKNDTAPSAKTIVCELSRRAERIGRILIVLDNVESVRTLFRGAAFEGLPFSSEVCLVATARTVDVVFRSTARAIEYPLFDLSPEAANKLLQDDYPPKTDDERDAAKNIARLLGFRALHLRAVPALLDDPYSPFSGSYASLESALRKNLLETVETSMKDYGEGERTPSVLWNLTKEQLSRHPRGAEWIRIAHAASFFSPTGFQKHILRHLWESFSGSEDNSGQSFQQTLDILRRHGVLFESDSGQLSMHRLTSAALRRSARTSEANLEEKLGRTLACFDGVSPSDWLSLDEHPSVLRFIPECSLLARRPKYYRHPLIVSSIQIQLLRDNPNLENLIRWDAFNGFDWVELLSDRPQFADRCPWETLDGWMLVALLVRQPQLVNHCPLDKLDGTNWAKLLRTQPGLADRCPWETLSSAGWAELLEKNPTLANHCPQENKDGAVWASLLVNQPSLADQCPWEKLKGKDWVRLLGKQPQFVERCSSTVFEEVLSSYDWVSLLEEQPDFAGRCPWESLNSFDWQYLLTARPQFAEHCPWERMKNEWRGLDWACLLSYQPQFAEHCPWEEFEGYDWALLLSDQPQFAVHCHWDALKEGNWLSLLDARPEFAERCREFNSLGTGWAIVLCFLPQLAERCPWESLDGDDWSLLLWEQPQFSRLCPWDQLCGGAWATLLSAQPQLAHHCPWEKLDEDDWSRLLNNQPQFSVAKQALKRNIRG